MIMGLEKDIMLSDVINIQVNTRLPIVKHKPTKKDQLNKGVPKKSMIQQTLFQSYA